MQYPQFSIRTLLAVVAIVATVIAAPAIMARFTWPVSIITIALLMGIAALLAVVSSRESGL
ncbi:hypothetical protein PLANPX_4759 [Lacipirellula parvula]|uniref:Uncharacterized protein n=1 Tax=Lacipirellula parvula TaxID=2650471 RepID=A0A5K7XGN0_9BACT|nr:hypothetical protein PLANPX_4759 [Lacipirellula parvula]